jgi:hypothetical protein
VTSAYIGVDVTPKRELPSFAPKEPHSDRTKREVQLENLAKGREKMLENRRKRMEGPTEVLTTEIVMENLRGELLSMWPAFAAIMKKQMREGSQAMKYKAALDWRDMIVGRPSTARAEEELGGDIVIVSPIVARLQEGMQKNQSDASD